MDSFFVENNFQAAHHSSEIYYPDSELHNHQPPEKNATKNTIAENAGFPLNKPFNQFAKRCFDILFSTLLIVTVLWWLIPVFAIFIRSGSKGPVFFRQKRNGNNGKLFTCIKFRTMLVNEQADILAARINDERITKFGRLLRRYHLDELPQVFNVLVGHMSIIGPRPYMVKENLYYENILEAYAHRHKIKPGITGLAQSFGYIGTFNDLKKVKERFDLDIEYICNWSFKMDLKILCRTATMITGVRSKKANIIPAAPKK